MHQPHSDFKILTWYTPTIFSRIDNFDIISPIPQVAMRQRRMYRSKKLYELCFRAQEGLPLPARPLINFLIQSALARTQRDDKVILSNYVWMKNHPHISLISQDVEALKAFYGELKKRLTDMIKRLLGLERLSLWPKEPTVMEILDIDAAIERHVYYFLNPARANLEQSIDLYPGETTWKAFSSGEALIDTKVEIEVPWIRLPSIPLLSRANPSKIEELEVIKELKESNARKENLIFYPFAWIKAFGITDKHEVEQIRQRIVNRVRLEERELALKRAKEDMGICGSNKLSQEPILIEGYQPKKKERKIYFLSSSKEARLRFIDLFKRFSDRCTECYRLACTGVKNLVWPEGAFLPPIPPLVNPL